MTQFLVVQAQDQNLTIIIITIRQMSLKKDIITVSIMPIGLMVSLRVQLDVHSKSIIKKEVKEVLLLMVVFNIREVNLLFKMMTIDRPVLIGVLFLKGLTLLG